jgi:ABC transporter with metal-binding/Fe-S-binding domain ATP-binding protein
MNLAVLFSGGKDSTYAAYLAQKFENDISCFITVASERSDSYMFHTPNILRTVKQAEVAKKPILIKKTQGVKEEELKDLEDIISKAKKEYKIEGIVTGAVESAYQASRVQKICNKLDLDCFNPLWQKDQIELLEDLIFHNFDVMIIGVFAYPLDNSWLGRKIDKKFIEDAKKLRDEYQINPAGEGGEFETFVLNCPLFSRNLRILGKQKFGQKNSWIMELNVI